MNDPYPLMSRVLVKTPGVLQFTAEVVNYNPDTAIYLVQYMDEDGNLSVRSAYAEHVELGESTPTSVPAPQIGSRVLINWPEVPSVNGRFGVVIGYNATTESHLVEFMDQDGVPCRQSVYGVRLTPAPMPEPGVAWEPPLHYQIGSRVLINYPRFRFHGRYGVVVDRNSENNSYRIEIADGTEGCIQTVIYGDKLTPAPTPEPPPIPVEVTNRLVPIELYDRLVRLGIIDPTDTRKTNEGSSNYAQHTIQPWSIWMDYPELTPWDHDIVKRILRVKEGDPRVLDYQKIIHICQERIRQLEHKGE
jgi:hypothetical protein